MGWPVKKIRFFFSLVTLILLGGCVTVKEVYGPDGRKAYTLNCSDDRSATWDHCYEKAGEICLENGYTILEKNIDQSASGSAGTLDEEVFGRYDSENNRVLMIQCN